MVTLSDNLAAMYDATLPLFVRRDSRDYYPATLYIDLDTGVLWAGSYQEPRGSVPISVYEDRADMWYISPLLTGRGLRDLVDAVMPLAERLLSCSPGTHEYQDVSDAIDSVCKCDYDQYEAWPVEDWLARYDWPEHHWSGTIDDAVGEIEDEAYCDRILLMGDVRDYLIECIGWRSVPAYVYEALARS